MPCTWPLKFPVARKDSSRGSLIAKTSLEPFRLPMVNSENDAGLAVWYSASAAAIFIGWYCRHDLALDVTGQGGEHRGDEDGDRAGLGRRAERGGGGLRGGVRPGRAPDQVPQGHRGDQGPGHQEAARNRVRERDQLRRVRQHGHEAGQFLAVGGRVVVVADRVLHPGVGGQDEVGGQHRADRDDPDAGRVHAPGQPVPAEDPQAQERGLEEEGEQRLDGQRRAEDVAHEPRIGRPVHAELEFLHDAGDHAHGEVDQEQLPVELRQPQPPVVPGAQPRGLESGHQERQADRDRHEQEVVHGGDAELPP